MEAQKHCSTNGFPFLLVVLEAPADRKTFFTNGFPFLLMEFPNFSASRRQKKWNSIGFRRVEPFRDPYGVQKEREFHWVYKVSLILRKSSKR